MRTHTVPEATRLRARRKNYHMRVEIQNAAGAWVDYSAAYGRNWLRSVKWDDSIERRVMQGSVTLMREDRTAGISLAPTMTGSAANAGGSGILEGRGIRLYGAVTDAAVAPVLTDWYELLRGEIDDVEYGKKSPNLVVGFRDIGARVLDCFINLERVYGSAGGVPVDTVMQQIINDNWDVAVSGPAPVLYVPTPLDSSFAVSPMYKQPQKSLLEALNDLAQQFGMVVRYKYDALGAFRLTLYDPQRTKVIPDAAFTRGEYIELPVLRRSRDDVRNQILVLYRDAAGILQSYYEEDTVSMAAYGPRYAQFGLNITSQIRTAAKAQAFAQAALSDLSTPLSTHQVESPLYWPVELGDLYTYASNERQYDQSQDLAVVSWEHTWTAAGKARTRIDTSGRVKGAVKQWIRNGGPIALDYFAPKLYAQFTYDDNTRTADVTAYVSNNGNESIGLMVSDGNTSDIYVLCVSAVDPTPKFVPSGTAIGPTEYFYLVGTGQIQRLNDIPLQDFATTALWLKAYGQLSGLESPWLTLTLKQAIPLPSVTATVSAGNPVKLGGSYAIKLTLTLVGGPNTASCGIRMVDIAADPADAIVDAVNIAPGEIVTRSYPIVASAAQILDKVWGAYLIASNKPLGYVPPPAALLGTEILVTSQGDTIAPADQEDMEVVQGDVATLQTNVTGLAGAQYLVSAASANLTAERVVADDPTVAWDFGTGGVARAYVPNLGIGTAQLGTSAVTTAKIADDNVTPVKLAAGGTTRTGSKFYRDDGTWQDLTSVTNASPWKAVVRVATTAAGTLASSFRNGDTIDGVVLVTGDRILIKDQAAASENGIYTVNASGAPTRGTDADSSAELVNATCYVSEGTTNADTLWTQTANAPITVGTTALAFAQLTSGGGVGSVTFRTDLTRTVSATVNDTIELGSVALTSGLWLVTVRWSQSGAVTTKSYWVPVAHDATTGAWQTVQTAGFAQNGTADLDLEVNVSTTTTAFRLRRTVVGGAGTLAASITLEFFGGTAPTFTTSTTAATSAITAFYGNRFRLSGLDQGGASNGHILAWNDTTKRYEPTPLVPGIVANTQTASYTLVLGDASKVIEMNVATANNLTVPTNASVAFPIGTILEVYQMGAGVTTILPASGVVIRYDSSLTMRSQYATVSLRKRGTDEWVASGQFL